MTNYPNKTTSYIHDLINQVAAEERGVGEITITDQTANEANMVKKNETNTTSGYTLTKSIPIPTEGSRNGKAMYPWKNMQEGDSFFVPNAKAASLQNQCSGYNKNLAPKKFLARTWTEKDVIGVRVWRSI